MIVRKVDDKSFKLKNFRLSRKACAKLARASRRVGLPEVRIMEELINRYAEHVTLEIRAGTDQNGS